MPHQRTARRRDANYSGMDENLPDRVTRLEESHAFLERTTEHLHEEMLTLVRKVEALTARLAKAESALSEKSTSHPTDAGGMAADQPPEFELPPHAHRPVDPHAGRTTDPFGPTGEPPEGVR